MTAMIENDGSVVAALSVFLLERIAEREALAHAVRDWPEAPMARDLAWHTTPGDPCAIAWGLTCVAASTEPKVSEFIASHDPARVLAECAAQRAIIEGDYWERNDGYVGIEVIEDVFRRLALPDANHPDYRDEWKPWT